MDESKVIRLDRALHVSVSRLEETLLVYLAYLTGRETESWLREMIESSTQNEFHAALKRELSSRVTGSSDDDQAE